MKAARNMPIRRVLAWRFLGGKMRLPILLLALILASVSLSAQTQRYIAWDPNPASDNVTYYTLTFDSTVFSVPPAVDGACACVRQAVTIGAGPHTATVTATNLWGTSAATTLTFNANAAGKPTNPRVQ